MRHGQFSADHDLSGPQKFHGRPVPRVGGAGVMAAVVAGVVIAQVSKSPASQPLWLLLACSLPAFAAGITEDLTKNVSPRQRLVATAVSASMAIWLLGAVIGRTDIPGVDQLIRWVPFAWLLSVFVITGVANSVNAGRRAACDQLCCGLQPALAAARGGPAGHRAGFLCLLQITLRAVRPKTGTYGAVRRRVTPTSAKTAPREDRFQYGGIRLARA